MPPTSVALDFKEEIVSVVGLEGFCHCKCLWSALKSLTITHCKNSARECEERYLKTGGGGGKVGGRSVRVGTRGGDPLLTQSDHGSQAGRAAA